MARKSDLERRIDEITGRLTQSVLNTIGSLSLQEVLDLLPEAQDTHKPRPRATGTKPDKAPRTGKKPAPPERMQQMVTQAEEFFAPLVEQLTARGGDIVFIRMPSRGKFLENDEVTNYRELTWDPMAEAIDAIWINTMDYAYLSSELDIPEWSHLSRQSQDDFSRRIVPVIDQRYREARGKSVHDFINAPERAD